MSAYQRGFQTQRSRVHVTAEGESLDIGKVVLQVGSCDAPGVICDYFDGPFPPRPTSSGEIRAPKDCAFAFASNKTYCAGDKNQEQTDLRIVESGKEIHLIAMNGSRSCSDTPKLTDFRIDGLGPGDELCLYTHDGHLSHIFFAEEVTPSSAQIALWHVTRKR